MLDSERIIPGLCLISKIAEDFPFVDYHSRNKEGQKTQFKNWHQDVFVFSSFGSQTQTELYQLYREILRQSNHGAVKLNQIQEFREYNHYRYTFIRNLF